MKTFFLESTCACFLGPWPWPRAFLSLASRVSVLGKAVLGLGLGFFLCPWPWPRALCPRLHLWYQSNDTISPKITLKRNKIPVVVTSKINQLFWTKYFPFFLCWICYDKNFTYCRVIEWGIVISYNFRFCSTLKFGASRP